MTRSMSVSVWVAEGRVRVSVRGLGWEMAMCWLHLSETVPSAEKRR